MNNFYRFFISFLVLVQPLQAYLEFPDSYFDEASWNPVQQTPMRPITPLVIEHSSIPNYPHLKERGITCLTKARSLGQDESKEHALTVSSVVSSLTPSHSAYLAEFEEIIQNDALQKKILKDKSIPFVSLSINFWHDLHKTNSTNADELLEKNPKISNFFFFLKKILKSGRVVIFSAGNDGIVIDTQDEDISGFKPNSIETCIRLLSPNLGQYIIVAGATGLDRNRDEYITEYSNIPYIADPVFFNQFVWAPGTFKVRDEIKKEEILHGTSFAAPVITSLLSRILAFNSNLTPREALKIVYASCKKDHIEGYNEQYFGNHGAINPKAALLAAHLFSQQKEEDRLRKEEEQLKLEVKQQEAAQRQVELKQQEAASLHHQEVQRQVELNQQEAARQVELSQQEAVRLQQQEVQQQANLNSYEIVQTPQIRRRAQVEARQQSKMRPQRARATRKVSPSRHRQRASKNVRASSKRTVTRNTRTPTSRKRIATKTRQPRMSQVSVGRRAIQYK